MKRHLQHTPSTAHKQSHMVHDQPLHFQSVSHLSHLSHSPNLMTPSHRRNDNGISSKITSIKSALDELISSVSEKRGIQRNTVQRVYDANSELCDHLGREYEFPRALSVQSLRREQPQELHRKSAYEEASTHIDKSQVESNHHEESIRIKQSLNGQISHNNALMSRLKSLQQEHEYLRSQQQNSVSAQDLEENRRLKEELARLNMQPNGYTAEDLWREFCELKEENQRLRQETIFMLKAEKGERKFYEQNNRQVYCAY